MFKKKRFEEDKTIRQRTYFRSGLQQLSQDILLIYNLSHRSREHQHKPGSTKTRKHTSVYCGSNQIILHAEKLFDRSRYQTRNLYSLLVQ